MQKTLLEEIEFRKEAERKKDEFISVASHELKTPLTSIKGYIQLLERSIDNSDIPTIKNRVSKVRSQIEKLNQLVADLLDIANIENGKLKFNKKYFSVDDMLDNVIEFMQHSNPDFKITRVGYAGKEVFGGGKNGLFLPAHIR